MKTVINALQYKQNSSGIGVSIKQLFGRVSEFSCDEVLVVLAKDSPEFPVNEEDKDRISLYRIPFKKSQNLQRLFFQTFVMGRKFCKDSILLTTDSKVPFFLPKSCKVVSLISDLATYRMPEAYQKSRVLWWKLQYRYLIKRADLFLCVSEFTKRDMTELWNIPENKIHVVYNAADKRFKLSGNIQGIEKVKLKYGIPEKYFLFVGNFNPRKNLERIILAYDKLKKETDCEEKLVIVGEHGWKFSQNKALKDIKYKEEIIFTDYVADEDLPAIYEGAKIFLFPTLYEGFGIPIVEAQSCGTPVLTSNITAMPEIAGKAAVYVNPYDVDDICEKTKEILQSSELRKKLKAEGLENIKRFDWETSARKVNRILENLKRY